MGFRLWGLGFGFRRKGFRTLSSSLLVRTTTAMGCDAPVVKVVVKLVVQSVVRTTTAMRCDASVVKTVGTSVAGCGKDSWNVSGRDSGLRCRSPTSEPSQTSNPPPPPLSATPPKTLIGHACRIVWRREREGENESEKARERERAREQERGRVKEREREREREREKPVATMRSSSSSSPLSSSLSVSYIS